MNHLPEGHASRFDLLLGSVAAVATLVVVILLMLAA